MNFEIPCAVFARLSHIIDMTPADASVWFRSIRIDNGVAVASNRKVIVCERITQGMPGAIHIIADPILVEQCKREAPFDSVLHITVNEMLKYATAATSMGYNYPGNAVIFSDEKNELEPWRTIVPTELPKKPQGGMFWNTEIIANIGKSSPSGRLIFQQVIDVTQPMIIRDIDDDQWFAFTYPRPDGPMREPASLPGWFK